MEGTECSRRGDLELVDSTSGMMVAGEFYDDEPCVDLSKAELIQGLMTFADVDMQQTGDEYFRPTYCAC